MTVKTKAKPSKKTAPTSTVNLAKVCEDLRLLQRQRAIILKSRNMQSNRIQAIIAGTLGYQSNIKDEAKKKKFFTDAAELISNVVLGAAHPMSTVIIATQTGIDAFNAEKERLEAKLKELATLLPVADWVTDPAQRGFGLLSLATVVGECGNLTGYSNPGKIWRRMGCAPWTHNGLTLMGKTWKCGKEGKLPAEEWSKFGYCPRRRSIAYLIGENIVKMNGADSEKSAAGKKAKGIKTVDVSGPYRLRYDAAKVHFKEVHPDYSDLRCHLHAMLLATKLMLKNLWIEWHRAVPDGQKILPFSKNGKHR